MSSFIIEGGGELSGSITPQGAKNEALEVLCAALLTSEPVTYHNVPEIRDVQSLLSMISALGVLVVKLAPNTYRLHAQKFNEDYLSSPEFRERMGRLRGSVMLVGALLARLGHATIAKPGGDKIGRRHLDTHFLGFRKLGASMEFNDKDKSCTLSAPRAGLKGCYMLLDEASVTGTANIILAATAAHGLTTIYNAACEPYIQQLCRLLTHMGAKIDGIGSNLITIHGCRPLHGTEHRLLPDMIETGSFIAMAAMTGSRITIKNVGYEHLGIIPDTFTRFGIHLEKRADNIIVPKQEHYEIDTFLDGSILKISDSPWPGLTPDLLSVMLVTATQAKGSVLIHQKMFESRLFFVDKLIDMGAQIILCDPHRAVVVGHDHRKCLKAGKLTSPDIRAGIALLIAALSAQGTSVIYNAEEIDRGYENLEARLRALGAKITRTNKQ